MTWNLNLSEQSLSKQIYKLKGYWIKSSTILMMFFNWMIQQLMVKLKNNLLIFLLFYILINVVILDLKMLGMLFSRRIKHWLIQKKERFTYVSWDKLNKGLSFREISKTKKELNLGKILYHNLHSKININKFVWEFSKTYKRKRIIS